ncbi:hypothetical protein IE53DRAFT_27941 [Violaceomyces palustris]|uniref:Uncharacterized protein n=1 Tax=Violaceomyces palustris TaxID=1673888 RepID=A0ACD0P1P2_9BASI|nr:hypothetical protein IE53DRAFT_27941 [Violaceomyces palustris]
MGSSNRTGEEKASRTKRKIADMLATVYDGKVTTREKGIGLSENGVAEADRVPKRWPKGQASGRCCLLSSPPLSSPPPPHNMPCENERGSQGRTAEEKILNIYEEADEQVMVRRRLLRLFGSKNSSLGWVVKLGIQSSTACTCPTFITQRTHRTDGSGLKGRFASTKRMLTIAEAWLGW